jgi:3-oxoacyl-[acyl-carrier-protein] synthase-3
MPTTAETVAQRQHFVQMNGREVFKFATRVLVSSAEAVLATCGRTIDDVDVYVPHQANVRIIEHARKKLGIPEEKVVIDVDRFGNTSSGSIPLALADAREDGRLRAGKLVLMTGMGAGLTWGSGLIEWTDGGPG